MLQRKYARILNLFSLVHYISISQTSLKIKLKVYLKCVVGDVLQLEN